MLTDWFSYNPESGILVWKQKRNRNEPGDVLKSKTDSGYIKIMLYRKTYLAHHLAFYLMTGKFPTSFVDHIDGDKANNRWDNLRFCSKAENAYNVGLVSANTSGHKGVTWKKDKNKWKVYLRVKGKQKHCGYFDDFEFACLVADEARNLYHGEFANHG